jgi:hypothetical protein
MALCVDAWVEPEGTWAVFEENGVTYTALGLPKQDEVDHVRDFHAGRYCPVVTQKYGQACAWNIANGSTRAMCHDPGLAGKW